MRYTDYIEIPENELNWWSMQNEFDNNYKQMESNRGKIHHLIRIDYYEEINSIYESMEVDLDWN